MLLAGQGFLWSLLPPCTFLALPMGSMCGVLVYQSMLAILPPCQAQPPSQLLVATYRGKSNTPGAGAGAGAWRRGRETDDFMQGDGCGAAKSSGQGLPAEQPMLPAEAGTQQQSREGEVKSGSYSCVTCSTHLDTAAGGCKLL